MALASMTGFARMPGDGAGRRWVWELAGINSKGLDIRLRLPPGSEALEIQARRLIGSRVSRGTVTGTLTLDYRDQDPGYTLNEPLLRQLLDMARTLEPEGVEPPRLDGLLAVRGVLVPVTETLATDTAAKALEQAQMASLEAALGAFLAAREDEGQRLGAVLSGLLDDLEHQTRDAASREALRPEAVRARLERQIEELLSASGTHRISEERLFQELALLALKADVREELDRLRSHIEGARELLDSGEPCGRRLEFLSQELNREANTLCAKSQDVALTRIGMDMKATINQFREQVLNLE
ncbi:YicC family protein [Phaeovibrio sulfidiphilus]|uniref:YicC family protein n=1 Tax=Phaeovibrio sulfidiphilus TaxID=1220600 RepID=A0A8J6YH76_9PROT|nr:YicC/YloC family endoribonuclease [Phaeovibrio sulfidiphilus]MBE1236246.1 YicC family protein [Phaeovibrio sulfidiphilus]